jgi:hypothetical protein
VQKQQSVKIRTQLSLLQVLNIFANAGVETLALKEHRTWPPGLTLAVFTYATQTVALHTSKASKMTSEVAAYEQAAKRAHDASRSQTVSSQAQADNQRAEGVLEELSRVGGVVHPVGRGTTVDKYLASIELT